MDDYTPPSDLAVDIAVRLREKHAACATRGVIPGGCTLWNTDSSDVQEILDLAAELQTEKQEA